MAMKYTLQISQKIRKFTEINGKRKGKVKRQRANALLGMRVQGSNLPSVTLMNKKS